MTDRERETRRLRAELLRAREDLEQEREKVAYLTGEIAELRRRVPTIRRQAAAPIVGTSRPTDPLERLFAALRPNHRLG
jgi:chromosome segregation ATPase